MFDRRVYNYNYVVEVTNGEYSETYEVTAQANDEALDEARELFMDDYNVGSANVRGTILSYDRIS